MLEALHRGIDIATDLGLYVIVDWHMVAEYTRDKLCVVPEALVKQARDATDCVGVTITVGVLEVVTLRAILLTHFDDVSVSDLWRDVHSIVLDLTGEDLVWLTIELTYEGNPHLRAILEADDICWD